MTPARVAYLVNQYPQPSQSFIRREVAALEAGGVAVDRHTVRAWRGPLPDPADEAERGRTRVVLDAGALGLVGSTLACLLRSPGRFLDALKAARRLGRVSERGTPIHLVYLAEACVLKGRLATSGATHLHAHFGTNSATVALLCRLLGGPPYSFTAHGPEEFDAPRALSLGEKVARSAFAVAISRYGRSQLCRWAASADWGKVVVVPCGLDAMFLGGVPTPPPADPRLVYVGRIVEQKGPLVLVEAAGLLHRRGIRFQLDMVGDGPMRGEVEAAIAREGLGEHLRLLGVQGNAEVRAAILGARALVLPSFAEGLPVVLMEALALGRPVVSTYVAGIPELVTPECGWLVPAGDPAALADAMASALSAGVDELARMGAAGARRAADRHDARRAAGALAGHMGVAWTPGGVQR